MPTYLYACSCGKEKEMWHSMSEDPIVMCECHKAMHRKITAEYSGVSRKTGDGDLSDWEQTKYRNT